MGKKGKEAARERREQRRREVTLLRAVPYEPDQRWWDGGLEPTGRAVAVVTGANRGIGYEIARQLALHGLHVVLTSRDAARVRDAADKILAAGEPGVSVEWRQLDVTDAASVGDFAAWAAQTHGRIHILVNNAGVNFNRGADNSVEFAEQVIQTNYFGTKRMIEAMMPLMKPFPHGGRIVNRIGDASLRDRLLNDDHLSEELIDEMVMKFLKRTKQDDWSPTEWPQMYTDYSISKLAVNAYTRLLAMILSDRPEGQKIYINCFCPGWVKTAMTGWEGNISAEEDKLLRFDWHCEDRGSEGRKGGRELRIIDISHGWMARDL
ncbi:hypothetical protein GUJ93_ZPchr0007g3911 [Zizania palustris]|uniref:Uncharacterized protein n=1 Tax=Zizania palustris TaxID=103762 RepID=A0A8J5W4M8_ZIZPA|nr:hypothetical protein GUJ93_ZPchr0007g3911 [Zizania palustris]